MDAPLRDLQRRRLADPEDARLASRMRRDLERRDRPDEALIEPPPFAAPMLLRVFVEDALGAREAVGWTPRAAPLKLPPCATWGVEVPRLSLPRLAEVWELERERRIPILRLAEAPESWPRLAPNPSLEGLELAGDTEDAPASLWSAAPGLRRVELAAFPWERLGELRALPELRALSWPRPGWAPVEALEAIAGMARLEVFWGSTSLTPAMARSAGLARLRGLELNAPARSAAAELAGFEGLERLRLRAQVGTGGTASLPLSALRGGGLRRLELESWHLSGRELAGLEGIASLRSVIIEASPSQPQDIAALRACDGLEALILPALRTGGLSALRAFPRLRRLDLGYDAGRLTGLPELPALERFARAHCELGPREVARLGRLPRLRAVELWPKHSRGTRKAIRELVEARGLRELSLWDARLGDVGLRTIAGPSLEGLALRGRHLVTGAGLRALRGCPRLRALHLEDIDLSGAGGILAGIEGLEALAITGDSLAEEADWRRLAGHPGLRRLVLPRTAAGVAEALQAALPEGQVELAR